MTSFFGPVCFRCSNETKFLPFSIGVRKARNLRRLLLMGSEQIPVPWKIGPWLDELKDILLGWEVPFLVCLVPTGSLLQTC